MPTIYTHGGGAHRDEFLACAVVLAVDGMAGGPWRIVRDPQFEASTAGDLDYVVDTGRVYDPAALRFDHHQDQALPCSLALVLKHYGLLADAYQWYPWLEFTDVVDTQGPGKACEWLDIGREALGRTQSPVENAILSAFERETQIEEGSTLFEVLRAVGREIVDGIRDRVARLELLRRRAVVEWRDGHAFAIYFLERVTRPELALRAFRYAHARGASVVITCNPRGTGWRLCRFDGVRGIDFRRLESEPDVQFVHASGHLAVTRDECSAQRLQELVRLAVVPTAPVSVTN